MPEPTARPLAGPITAVVVTYESAATLDRCLECLAAAAPRRGVQVVVADNASTDGSAAIAERRLGPGGVVRLARNGGFAAGVNAGFARASGDLVAVLNPDVEVPAGGLDALADVLERHPRAALAGPRTLGHDGVAERTVGPFPTAEREWAHSWLLDHAGWPGRFAPQPDSTARVDWVSGCGWLVRTDAVRAVGPLDEEYFMYFEDVDYCRRLHDGGWDVLHVPEVTWKHGLGKGSSGTGAQPADGGLAAVRYFRKHVPQLSEAQVRGMLVRGWWLRRLWRAARAALGHAPSAGVARRYAIAIEQVRGR
ncbi:MAG: glycosyltransferase family 2 protein [Candidatus Eisenbacteria bacterium]|uniref:Glycosyltransferase family 2 protein n=1 Tax=Eiseniibacteriota bacterium TaxID=2212470 RepID=A0A933SGF2_UNCEI|nr:glycosyltransferase family 2 protein [Candidatus Eisenbacteria bacterium]